MADPIAITQLNSLTLREDRVTLLSIVRDESYLLPFLLDHYRRLGVRQFAFIDDRSQDGTRALLLAQPDCMVLECNRAWGERIGKATRLHHHLKRFVPERLAGSGWVLTVDADEFLFLPPGFADIAALTAHLDAIGQVCIPAALVDFYPPTLAGRNFDRGLSPFAGCPLFDRGPLFDWRPGRLQPFPAQAGVRARLAAMLFADHRADFVEVYAEGFVLASLWKVPLLHWGRGVVPVGDHAVSAPPFLGMQAALAHFKFCPGLDDKIAQAVSGGAYHRASLEYRMLARSVALLGNRPLVDLATRRWSGPAALEAAFLTYVT
ncbi:MAG: glycosyltransferase family 2 protein [Alphaproteobacteria bacterium]|nr:glycosyltransferase family 2 protein [Alphaproteobacteria bacterium]